MSEEKRVLSARDGLGYVYECNCGTIHVGVGPMDLRMTREGLLEIHQMLEEAVAQLATPAPAPPLGGPSKVYTN